MHVRSLAILLALAGGMTSTVSAQYPDGDSGPGAGGPGGMRHGHGMMGGGPGGGMMKPLDPVVVEGPPSPAEFAKITSVTDTQRYATLYSHFMTNTQPQRDSLAAARTAMRNAFEDRDREAARRQMSLLKSLGDDLSKQQETFDRAVKEMLKKEEWKKYQGWRSDRRQEAEDHRREMMGGRHEGGAPPEVPPSNQ
jgi:Spy/CpxP family protein refolding chaperone